MSVTTSFDGRFTAMYMADDRRSLELQRLARLRAALTERIGGPRVNGRLIAQIGEADLRRACEARGIDVREVLSA